MYKTIHNKPIAKTKLGGEKLKLIPLQLGTRLGWALSPYLFNKVREVSARAIRQLRQIKQV